MYAEDTEDGLPRSRRPSLDETGDPVRIAACPVELRPVQSGPDRKGLTAHIDGDTRPSRLLPISDIHGVVPRACIAEPIPDGVGEAGVVSTLLMWPERDLKRA
jgi:hypothetical protein